MDPVDPDPVDPDPDSDPDPDPQHWLQYLKPRHVRKICLIPKSSSQSDYASSATSLCPMSHSCLMKRTQMNTAIAKQDI